MASNVNNALLRRGAPTMAQANQNFTNNNPQFGKNPYGDPTGVLGRTMVNSQVGVSAPKPGQSSYVDSTAPVGTKAVSPQTNLKAPKNTLPPGQAAPPTPPVSTAINQAPTTGSSNTAAAGGLLTGNPSVYNYSTGGLLRYGMQDDPEYNRLIAEKSNIAANEPAAITAIQSDTTRGIPETVMQSRENATTNRYSAQLSAKEAEIANYLSARGQNIGALGTAAGQTHPEQVSPGNFFVSPETGADVTRGAINPFSGGQRQAQVSAGQTYQSNLPILGTAKSFVNDFNSTLSGANLNTSDLNAANWLNNVYAANTSNPAFPRLQSSFNNAISQYAKVFGVDPNTFVNSLLPLAQGQTISTLLSDLDSKAGRYNENIRLTGQGGEANTTATAPAPAQQAASGGTSGGVTPSGVKYTVVQQ